MNLIHMYENVCCKIENFALLPEINVCMYFICAHQDECSDPAQFGIESVARRVHHIHQPAGVPSNRFSWCRKRVSK